MSSKDDPLEQTQIKGFVLSLILTAILFTGSLIPSEDQNAPQVAKNKPNNEIIAEQSFVFLNGNTLLPISEQPVKTQILGMSVSPLLYKIIDCESDFRPYVCNKEFGCGAGMGLAQLVPSTVRYCEEKLGKSIDPFNPKDNIECASWLLRYEGPRHWGFPPNDIRGYINGKRWGTYDCWSKYL